MAPFCEQVRRHMSLYRILVKEFFHNLDRKLRKVERSFNHLETNESIKYCALFLT